MGDNTEQDMLPTSAAEIESARERELA